MKKNLKTYSLESLKQTMVELGKEPYRGEQLFKWIWQKNAKDFSLMTNISKDFRQTLMQIFSMSGLKEKDVLLATDKCMKFVLQTEDDENIEAVFIPEARRKTVCISSQIGCPLNCKFCATGLMNFKRNLKAYEIANQIQIVQNNYPKKISNVVFMGMGEPLLNLEEIIGAIKIISSPIGLSISQRHTTISTVGLINGIQSLLHSPLKVKLAISLNFPDEKLRQEMMPVTKENPLKELLKCAKEYSFKKNMVTFEYVIIDNLNDRVKDAKILLKLLKGIPSKINIIPYNPYPLLPYKRPPDRKIERFYEYLLSSPHTITLRKSRGQDILAGCGQLALLETETV
jgi:23S rRNA (adenine2503-C2)-methyltransferase